jgi:Na+/H+ antiporter NhaD/arsenite permease-like protein
MEAIILLVFLFVYFGMFLGEIPGLQIDRAGIALVGAIVLVMTDVLTPEHAWNAIDVSTIALLFGLMVISSQFRLGGFYTAVTKTLSSVQASPEHLLLLLILASAILSAFLANDIVCLAMTPILIEGCIRRGLNPIPYALALACSSNVGSALTLIGNPQNMLIGQQLQLHFSGYLLDSCLPVILSLLLTWWIIRYLFKDQWYADLPFHEVAAPEFNAWQSFKGCVILLLLILIFLFTGIPRESAALAGAAILLMSRKLTSREMLSLVDWQLLVLFMGLFVVNSAVFNTGRLEQGVQALSEMGMDLHQPFWLFIITVLLSNLVSNVPAVMLLIPFADHPYAGSILALSSTLAGNLILVGSIANLIVVDRARELGILIDWKQHARAGIPVTLATLLITALWLWLRIQLFPN